jgi:hypothetical protein
MPRSMNVPWTPSLPRMYDRAPQVRHNGVTHTEDRVPRQGSALALMCTTSEGTCAFGSQILRLSLPPPLPDLPRGIGLSLILYHVYSGSVRCVVLLTWLGQRTGFQVQTTGQDSLPVFDTSTLRNRRKKTGTKKK